jgi:radical SAM superfamily enzyme YgiQ (UPF0313 family)
MVNLSRISNNHNHKILFIFPKWPELSLWSHFKYKFPPLGLLTIAGLTPDTFAIEFVDENVTPLNLNSDADLIAISVMTPLAYRAYEIGDHFRNQGKTVIMGGIHVSINPDEALNHANSVVIGEAEDIWPQVLQDFQNSNLKYDFEGQTL